MKSVEEKVTELAQELVRMGDEVNSLRNDLIEVGSLIAKRIEPLEKQVKELEMQNAQLRTVEA